MKEMVGGCCVCSDERGWPDNPLVYCDGNGCNVAVHQACYGIVTVPIGPWFCRKCESPDRQTKVVSFETSVTQRQRHKLTGSVSEVRVVSVTVWSAEARRQWRVGARRLCPVYSGSKVRQRHFHGANHFATHPARTVQQGDLTIGFSSI